MSDKQEKVYKNRRQMMDSGFYKFEFVREGDKSRTYEKTVYGCKSQKEAEERLLKIEPGAQIVELVQRQLPKKIAAVVKNKPTPKPKGKK